MILTKFILNNYRLLAEVFLWLSLLVFVIVGAINHGIIGILFWLLAWLMLVIFTAFFLLLLEKHTETKK